LEISFQVMKLRVSENREKVAELAQEIAKLDNDILSVDIVDEPGHLVAGYSKVEGAQGGRSASKEVWQSVSFQQALFFSGKREVSGEEVVVIDKNEYEILLRSPEQGIIVVAIATNLAKTVAEILTTVERIRKLMESLSN